LAQKAVLIQFGNHRVFAFYGQMGVGNNNFLLIQVMKNFCVKDVFSSPTFDL
jgi:hypothetical protein